MEEKSNIINNIQSFGPKNYIGLKKINNNRILNFTNFNNDYYRSVCEKIINNKEVDFNYSLLKKSAYQSIIKDEDSVTRYIVYLFSKLAIRLQKKIVNLYNNKNTKLIDIKKINDEYNKISICLKENVFSYYNKSLIIDNLDTSQKSYFFHIKNMIFNNLILKHEFHENTFLIDIIINIVKTSFYTIDDIINILKMYDFYDIKINENNEIKSNLILEILGDNMDFILKVNKYIDIKLISINKEMNIDTDYRFSSNDIKLLYSNIKDKNVFYMYYYQNLYERIINKKTNSKTEIYFSRIISDFENSTFRKINMLVHDLINNNKENKIYKYIQYSINKENYKDIQNFNNISLKKVKICNLRKYACKELLNNQNNNLILPSEIIIYKKIYESYYNLQFNNRNLNFIYDKSNVEITSNINNKIYTFLLSIPQSTTLMLFNRYKSLSTREIITNTNINNLDYLQNIINSFLSIKLIYRDMRDTREVLTNEEYLDIKFYINENFTNDNDYISLLNFKKNNKNSYNISKDSKLKIYKILSENNNISISDLFIKIDILSEKISITTLEKLLNDFEKVGMTKFINDKWIINESDSESDSSS